MNNNYFKYSDLNQAKIKEETRVMFTSCAAN